MFVHRQVCATRGTNWTCLPTRVDVGPPFRNLTKRERRQRQMRRRNLLGWIGLFAGGILVWQVYKKVQGFVDKSDGEKKKLVVLGSGFGALSMIKELDTSKFDVTLVSPKDSFLYTPFLPLCLVGSADIQSVTESLDAFSKRTNVKFKHYVAYSEDVNIEQKIVHCRPVQPGASEFDLDYDLLVIAVGGYQNTHGIDGVEKYCKFLNSSNDCRRLRNNIMDAFELCHLPGTTEEERAQNLHFVVAGGGPIARTIAAELHDFVCEQVKTIFPTLEPYVKVSLINMDDHIHNYYDHAISNYFKKHWKKNYNIINQSIVNIEAKKIILQDKDGENISVPYGTCIWATGTVAHPLAKKIAEKLPEQSNHLALLVDPSLKVLGASNIFAVGDCATIDQKDIMNWVQQKRKLGEDEMLDIEEWKALTLELSKKHPALKEIGKRAEILFEQSDINKDGKLSGKELAATLKLLDQNITRFPSTASTAVQQGRFLAQQLNLGNNQSEKEMAKFRYKHIGGFEYVGAENGLVERGSKGKFIVEGPGALWMWTNVYYSFLVGMKMRASVSTSRLITLIFGREPTRY